MAAIPEVNAIKDISDEIFSTENRIIFLKASCKVKHAILKKYGSSYNNLIKENEGLKAEVDQLQKRNTKLKSNLKRSQSLKTTMYTNISYLKKALLEKNLLCEQAKKSSEMNIKHYQSKWIDFHNMYENASLAVQRKKMKSHLVVAEFNLMKSKMDLKYLNNVFDQMKEIENVKMRHLIVSFVQNAVEHTVKLKIISVLKNNIKAYKKNSKELEAEKIRVLHYIMSLQTTQYLCKHSLHSDMSLDISNKQELFNEHASNLPMLSFSGSSKIPVLQLPQDMLQTVEMECENSLENIETSLVCSIELANTKTNKNNRQIQLKYITDDTLTTRGEEIIYIRGDNENKSEVAEIHHTKDVIKNDEKSMSILTIPEENKSNESVSESSPNNGQFTKQTKNQIKILEDISLKSDKIPNLIHHLYKKDVKNAQKVKNDSPGIVVPHIDISEIRQPEIDQIDFEHSNQRHSMNYKSTDEAHEHFMTKYEMTKSPIFVYAPPTKSFSLQKSENNDGESIYFTKKEVGKFPRNQTRFKPAALIEHRYKITDKLVAPTNITETKEITKIREQNSSVEHVDANIKTVAVENTPREEISEKKIEEEITDVNERPRESSQDSNDKLIRITNEPGKMNLNESFCAFQSLSTQSPNFHPSNLYSQNEAILGLNYGSPLNSEYKEDILQDYPNLIDSVHKYSELSKINENIKINQPEHEITQKENKPTSFSFGTSAFKNETFKMFTRDDTDVSNSATQEKVDSVTPLQFLFNKHDKAKTGSFFNFLK